jgi:hypothetical protein
MEGSLVAYKVFTNGSTLQASEINENLMQQSIAVFSNAAARSAAITSPVEGQITYLEDVNAYQSWNGSAWLSPFGTNLIVNQSFTSSTSVIVSNCFSSQYDVYEIVLLPTSGGASSSLQLRTGSTTQTTNYAGSTIFWNGSTVAGTNRATTAFFTLGSSERDLTDVKLSFPFNTRPTGYLSMSNQNGNIGGIDMGWLNTTTSYESLVVNFGSSTSGNIAIYGMRK